MNTVAAQQVADQAVDARRCGRVIGRVGALAVALGVGSVIAGLPAVAFADTTGSSGSTGSADRDSPGSSTPSGPSVN